MDEFVILVDGNDNPIGKEEKVKCHLPNGKLHNQNGGYQHERII